jgi:hypothetical protein
VYGPHYSVKPRKVSGNEWEQETLRILKELFPKTEIQSQVRFPQLPHAIIDFYLPQIKVAIECKACGLAPVPKTCDDNCSACARTKKCALLKNKRRQDVLKSLGIKYVWWADRERANLVPRTRKYLENTFYDCLGERQRFVDYLKRAGSYG